MITKLLSLFFFFLIFCKAVIGQDSAILVFKNIKISLPKSQSECRLVLQSSRYFETIFNIGKDRYFYIRQNTQDSLVVESGQMNLYSISDSFYLLREGNWCLENESEKVMFENFGEIGLIEEISVKTSERYGGFEKKRKRPIRRAVKRTVE